jgi:hypothetical protein
MIVLRKIFHYLKGNKPIFNIIIPNENKPPTIIKEGVKFKVRPVLDDKIYFNTEGPYYRVIGITHHINTFHVIWVSVEKII